MSQATSRASIRQLEPYKNITHSVELQGKPIIIRAVSTNTGQFFVLYQDLASALTGEKEPKKLKAPLRNARDRIQTSKSEATSLLMKPKEGMLTLVRALLDLKVCMQFYLCNLHINIFINRQDGDILPDGVYYHSWKRNDDSGHTSKVLALSMAAAREFICLCDSGDASKNRSELLALLLQVEQQMHASGAKVHTNYLHFLIIF